MVNPRDIAGTAEKEEEDHFISDQLILQQCLGFCKENKLVNLISSHIVILMYDSYKIGVDNVALQETLKVICNVSQECRHNFFQSRSWPDYLFQYCHDSTDLSKLV